jgi:transposase
VREFQGIFLFRSVSTEFPIFLGIFLDRRTSPDAALLHGMHNAAAAPFTTAVAHLPPLTFYAALRIQRGQALVSEGRPIDLFVTAGQVSDYVGARALLSGMPNVKWLLGDRGYDADWFREALQDKGIRACIPGGRQRKTPVKYDKRRYKRRNRIEIMFGRLKDWRRVATRYDRCPKVFLSAIALAALVIYWL